MEFSVYRTNFDDAVDSDDTLYQEGSPATADEPISDEEMEQIKSDPYVGDHTDDDFDNSEFPEATKSGQAAAYRFPKSPLVQQFAGFLQFLKDEVVPEDSQSEDVAEGSKHSDGSGKGQDVSQRIEELAQLADLAADLIRLRSNTRVSRRDLAKRIGYYLFRREELAETLEIRTEYNKFFQGIGPEEDDTSRPKAELLIEALRAMRTRQLRIDALTRFSNEQYGNVDASTISVMKRGLRSVVNQLPEAAQFAEVIGFLENISRESQSGRFSKSLDVKMREKLSHLAKGLMASNEVSESLKSQLSECLSGIGILVLPEVGWHAGGKLPDELMEELVFELAPHMLKLNDIFGASSFYEAWAHDDGVELTNPAMVDLVKEVLTQARLPGDVLRVVAGFVADIYSDMLGVFDPLYGIEGIKLTIRSKSVVDLISGVYRPGTGRRRKGRRRRRKYMAGCVIQQAVEQALVELQHENRFGDVKFASSVKAISSDPASAVVGESEWVDYVVVSLKNTLQGDKLRKPIENLFSRDRFAVGPPEFPIDTTNGSTGGAINIIRALYTDYIYFAHMAEPGNEVVG